MHIQIVVVAIIHYIHFAYVSFAFNKYGMDQQLRAFNVPLRCP